jgi:parallel beta-helix repeat protein
VTLAVALLLWPSVGGAAIIDVTCVNEKDLQAAVDAAAPFDTILVNGSCAEENLTIGSDKVGLTLNGKKVAEIHDSQNGVGAAAISVRGATQVTIRDFAGLTTNAADGVGVVVVDGASARIIGNTITGNQTGILVQRNAQARINGNTIRSNSDAGVRIRETSSARISPDPSPANTIQDNGVGVEVLRGSSARIFANQIVDNQTAGVRVDRGSQADITSNTIDGNGVNGIEVLRSSSVVLGTGMGTGPEDGPNTGTSTGFAVLCSLNSSVDGRLGALSGTNRRKVEAVEACVNSTSP